MSKFTELFRLSKQKEKDRSIQASISIILVLNSVKHSFSLWLRLRKKLFFLLLCFGIVIFRLGGKNCVVKNEKWIVFPESRYVNSNPELFFRETLVHHSYLERIIHLNFFNHENKQYWSLRESLWLWWYFVIFEAILRSDIYNIRIIKPLNLS